MASSINNKFSFLNDIAREAAPKLLGCILERKLNGKTLSGRIVEVEAYDQTDAASHSYKGKTPRTEVMFGDPGYLYVYFTYGMHYCCNVVVGPAGQGAAVLIRAIEPINGLRHMSILRNGRDGKELTNGPAKVCQALDINKQLNGHDLRKSPLKLIYGSPLANEQVIQTTRIGISQAKDIPWRFYISGNPYVSKN